MTLGPFYDPSGRSSFLLSDPWGALLPLWVRFCPLRALCGSSCRPFGRASGPFGLPLGALVASVDTLLAPLGAIGVERAVIWGQWRYIFDPLDLKGHSSGVFGRSYLLRRRSKR